jgi:hypothetical protein
LFLDDEDVLDDSFGDNTNGNIISKYIRRTLKSSLRSLVGRHLQKKKKLLGECQGNCRNDTSCALNLKCSKTNKGKILKKGYSNRTVYCDKKLSYTSVCYDPKKILLPMCPRMTRSEFLKCRNATQGKLVDCGARQKTICCRKPIEIFRNNTGYYATCERYQTCYDVWCTCSIGDNWLCDTEAPGDCSTPCIN